MASNQITGNGLQTKGSSSVTGKIQVIDSLSSIPKAFGHTLTAERPWRVRQLMAARPLGSIPVVWASHEHEWEGFVPN